MIQVAVATAVDCTPIAPPDQASNGRFWKLHAGDRLRKHPSLMKLLHPNANRVPTRRTPIEAVENCDHVRLTKSGRKNQSGIDHQANSMGFHRTIKLKRGPRMNSLPLLLHMIPADQGFLLAFMLAL